LIGFCTFGQDARVPGGDYAASALDIGLGVRPDLTGKGHGTEIVTAVVDFAMRTFEPQRLRVTIAEWNTRAQRVWERNGFVPQSRFVAITWTQKPFIIYGREAAL
jgi:ribosomal-protein-alanine N-acetyltransferase